MSITQSVDYLLDLLSLISRVLRVDAVLDLISSSPSSINVLNANVALAQKAVVGNVSCASLKSDILSELIASAYRSQTVDALPDLLENLKLALENQSLLKTLVDLSEFDTASSTNMEFVLSLVEDNRIAFYLSPGLWTELLQMAYPKSEKMEMHSAAGKEQDSMSMQPTVQCPLEEILPIINISWKDSIKPEEAIELLPVAKRWNLNFVAEKLVLALTNAVTLTNCIQIFQLANREDLEGLREDARDFLLLNFQEVCTSSAEFLNLTFEELQSLLISVDLFVESEEQVLDSITRWVKTDMTSRCRHLSALMTCVRLPCCSVPLLKKIQDDSLLAQLVSLQDSVSVILDLAESRPPQLRNMAEKQMRVKEILFLFGGENSDTLELLNEENHWIHLENIEHCPSGRTWSASLGRSALVIEDDGRRVRIWDPLSSDQWLGCEAMPHPRTTFSVTTLNGKIYVTGGWLNDTYTDRCDVFDPSTNTWSRVGSLNVARRECSTAALKGKLYCAGGWGGKVLSSMEVFDPVTNSWTLSTPMVKPRRELCLTACRNFIWAFGGFDGKRFLGDVERFDPESNTWTSMPPLPIPRANLTVAYLGGRFYAMGGWNGKGFWNGGYLNCTEVFNPVSNTWVTLRFTNTPRSHMGSCVLKLPFKFQRLVNLR